VLNLADAQPYVEDDGVVDFAGESVDPEVVADSEDPDFAEESEAVGLLSPLLSAAGAALLSDELRSDESLSDELDEDLGA
jgi:hypothetical protein